MVEFVEPSRKSPMPTSISSTNEPATMSTIRTGWHATAHSSTLTGTAWRPGAKRSLAEDQASRLSCRCMTRNRNCCERRSTRSANRCIHDGSWFVSTMRQRIPRSPRSWTKRLRATRASWFDTARRMVTSAPRLMTPSTSRRRVRGVHGSRRSARIIRIGCDRAGG